MAACTGHCQIDRGDRHRGRAASGCFARRPSRRTLMCERVLVELLERARHVERIEVLAHATREEGELQRADRALVERTPAWKLLHIPQIGPTRGTVLPLEGVGAIGEHGAIDVEAEPIRLAGLRHELVDARRREVERLQHMFLRPRISTWRILYSGAIAADSSSFQPEPAPALTGRRDAARTPLRRLSPSGRGHRKLPSSPSRRARRAAPRSGARRRRPVASAPASPACLKPPAQKATTAGLALN